MYSYASPLLTWQSCSNVFSLLRHPPLRLKDLGGVDDHALSRSLTWLWACNICICACWCLGSLSCTLLVTLAYTCLLMFAIGCMLRFCNAFLLLLSAM